MKTKTNAMRRLDAAKIPYVPYEYEVDENDLSGKHIADEIEQELQGSLEREIATQEIGEMVMSRLKDVDEVAYVRFASVYRSFKDINTFMEELSKILSEK